MKKEELVEKLEKVGIKGEWINPDEYGFSRTFQFELDGQVIQIEWYCNYSTLMIGNAHFWFDRILAMKGEDMKHEWMTNNPPEEICEYLVTDDCGCLQIATWTNEFYLGHKVIGEWHWERRSYTNVVAWMPLPHPYKSLNDVEQEIRARTIDDFAERLRPFLSIYIDRIKLDEIAEELRCKG